MEAAEVVRWPQLMPRGTLLALENANSSGHQFDPESQSQLLARRRHQSSADFLHYLLYFCLPFW